MVHKAAVYADHYLHQSVCELFAAIKLKNITLQTGVRLHVVLLSSDTTNQPTIYFPQLKQILVAIRTFLLIQTLIRFFFIFLCVKKAQKRRLFELAGQLRSSAPSMTIIRPGCQLLKEDNINVVNLSGNGRLHEKIVLLVRK